MSYWQDLTCLDTFSFKVHLYCGPCCSDGDKSMLFIFDNSIMVLPKTRPNVWLEYCRMSETLVEKLSEIVKEDVASNDLNSTGTNTT